MSGAVTSADLGSSSNYSNEIECLSFMAIQTTIFRRKTSNALKVVAGKVSLCVALKQGLVGPNSLAKALYNVCWDC